MELVLIRHGQPEWVRDGLNVDDPRLTDLGHEQARLTAAALTGVDVDRLFVSPLLRAQQTAAPIAEAVGLDAETFDFLAEIRNPEWDGTDHDVERIFSEARQRPAELLWDGLEGGESFREFHGRIGTGLAGLLGELGVRPDPTDLPLWEVDEPDRRYVVVAHAGTNSVILTHLLGVEPVPWEWERFVIHHASISTVETMGLAGAWSFSLTRLSDTRQFPAGLETR
ncbi:MAG: histidine phosphatase family protein [Actinomycetota bacterium]